MKRLVAALVTFWLAGAALAQSVFTMPPPAGVTAIGVQVVASCGGASLTAGQVAFVVMDTTGKICTSSAGGSGGSVTQGTTPWIDSINFWNGVALGSPTAYGTAPTGNVPGVNAFITNSPTVSIAANQSVNVNQFGGSAVVTGTGSGGAGIPRVTLSNDSTLAANQSVNVAQMGGTAITIDPCTALPRTNVAISQAASTQIITGTAAKKTYICTLALVAQAAETINITEGTGSVCATGSSAIMGSTTAANGLGFAANGGLTLGNGRGTVASSAVNADNVCLTQAGTSRVSGNLTYVQQ